MVPPVTPLCSISPPGEWLVACGHRALLLAAAEQGADHDDLQHQHRRDDQNAPRILVEAPHRHVDHEQDVQANEHPQLTAFGSPERDQQARNDGEREDPAGETQLAVGPDGQEQGAQADDQESLQDHLFPAELPPRDAHDDGKRVGNQQRAPEEAAEGSQDRAADIPIPVAGVVPAAHRHRVVALPLGGQMQRIFFLAAPGQNPCGDHDQNQQTNLFDLLHLK